MLTYGFVCPQMYFTAKQGKKMVKTLFFFLKTPREEAFFKYDNFHSVHGCLKFKTR